MKNTRKKLLLWMLTGTMLFQTVPVMAAEQKDNSGQVSIDGQTAVATDNPQTVAGQISEEWEKDYSTNEKPYQLQRIIVHASGSLPDSYGASRAIYYTTRSDYILEYSSQSKTKAAYENLVRIYGKENVSLDHLVEATADSGKTGSSSGSSYYSWGTHLMGLDALKSSVNADATRTRTVTVAVLDSGINASHKVFKGRKISRKSAGFLSCDLSDSKQKGYYKLKVDKGNYFNYYRPKSNYTDDFGHGSHVSGIITDGTSKQVELMECKVLDENGQGSTYLFLLAMDYAQKNGADVINISAGIDGIEKTDLEYKYLEKEFRILEKKNIPVVVASGNGKEDDKGEMQGENLSKSKTYPAYSQHVITVGSIGKSLKVSGFSNYGKALNYTAPGENIKSAYIYTTKCVKDSGTSMAAPHITASVAMIRLYHPSYTVAQIQNRLNKYAVDEGDPGWDIYYGNGWIKLPQIKTQKIALKTNKKLTLKKGKKTQIHVSAKTALWYRSSNTRIATVNSKGKISPKKKGTVKISIYARSTFHYRPVRKQITVTVK